MNVRATSRKEINTTLQRSRKSTQRDRLLAGMVNSANRLGYAGANVSEVIAEAGVSRPTFYEHFADRDDCFVATIAHVQQQLAAEVHSSVQHRAPEHADVAAIEALVGFAVHESAMARFLMKEALAGPGASLDARDAGIADIAAVIAEALARAGAAAATPDLPLTIAVGAVYRLLASRLRRGERALDTVLEDLIDWTDSYRSPPAEHRWSALVPERSVPRSPFLPSTQLQAPAPLAPGRPRLPEEEVSENHRQRIMFATCQVVRAHGYAAATIADITKLAGLDTRAFYRQFTNKQEALSAVYELGFQHLMKTAADAFFARASWPDRIWEALQAVTQIVQCDPAVAHIGFVAVYAVGPGEIQRVEDSRTAFGVFLQEGYRYGRRRSEPSAVALEAIMAAIFEIVYLQTHRSAEPETAALLPHIAHLCLAPFLGPKQTGRFIDRKLSTHLN